MTHRRMTLVVIAILTSLAPEPGLAQPARPARASKTPHASTAPRQLLQELSALLDSGQLAPARARADEALREFPSDAALHNIAGAIAAQQNEYETAERHFKAAIGVDPRRAPGYLNLGRLYQERAGDDPHAALKALAAYRQLLAIDPRHAEALFQAAYITAQLGEWKDSRRFVARLLARTDANRAGTAESLRDLGLVYSRAGQFEGARALLEGAITAAGAPTAPLLLDLARVAYKQQDFKGTLGYLAHARDLNPEDPEVHFFFGIACIELNLGSEAYDALERAVALAPDNPYVNYAMGAVAMHRHEPSEALPYLEKYVRLMPDDPRGRFVLGAARFYSNDFDAARADLQQATRSPDTAAGAHHFLARIARQLNELDTARQEIDRALQIKPAYPEALAELGLLQTRSQDYDAAARTLTKALSLDPENYAANFNLAALYARTKDPRRQEQEARVARLQERRTAAAQEFLRLIEVVK